MSYLFPDRASYQNKGQEQRESSSPATDLHPNYGSGTGNRDGNWAGPSASGSRNPRMRESSMNSHKSSRSHQQAYEPARGEEEHAPPYSHAFPSEDEGAHHLADLPSHPHHQQQQVGGSSRRKRIDSLSSVGSSVAPPPALPQMQYWGLPNGGASASRRRGGEHAHEASDRDHAVAGARSRANSHYSKRGGAGDAAAAQPPLPPHEAGANHNNGGGLEQWLRTSTTGGAGSSASALNGAAAPVQAHDAAPSGRNTFTPTPLGLSGADFALFGSSGRSESGRSRRGGEYRAGKMQNQYSGTGAGGSVYGGGGIEGASAGGRSNGIMSASGPRRRLGNGTNGGGSRAGSRTNLHAAAAAAGGQSQAQLDERQATRMTNIPASAAQGESIQSRIHSIQRWRQQTGAEQVADEGDLGAEAASLSLPPSSSMLGSHFSQIPPGASGGVDRSLRPTPSAASIGSRSRSRRHGAATGPSSTSAGLPGSSAGAGLPPLGLSGIDERDSFAFSLLPSSINLKAHGNSGDAAEEHSLGVASPLRSWVRWMSRSGLKLWCIECGLLLALLVRFATGLGGWSGKAVPPRFGDFEAQRHWMEMTYHLPYSQWYTYSEDWWRLDYPPLSAWVSLWCAKV